MSIQRYVILNHVDSPLKIFIWTKGELGLFLVPFLLGVLSDEFLLGLVFSLLDTWFVAKYKKTFGKGQLQAVKYWYLPLAKILKAFPPSYIREYVG